MICDNGDQVGSSCEVMPPLLQGMEYGEEFSIIDVVILLSWGEGLGMVGTRVEISIGISLHKHPPQMW